MPCNGPYETVGWNVSGTKQLGGCLCGQTSPCGSSFSIGGLYSLTNCCTPCTQRVCDYNYTNCEFQCIQALTPYGGFAPYNTNYYYYGYYGWVEPFNPLGNYLPILSYRTGFGMVSAYSIVIDFEDTCCATDFAGNVIITGGQYGFPYYLGDFGTGGFLCASSGNIKIRMASWSPSFDIWFRPTFTAPGSLTQIGFLPLALPPNSACGYAYRPFCTCPYPTGGCRYGPDCPECYLTESPLNFVAATFVWNAQSCTSRAYYGYDEIPVEKGEVIAVNFILLPTSIPSFEIFNFSTGQPTTVPSQSLPFIAGCQEDIDCNSWGAIVSTFCCFGNTRMGGWLYNSYYGEGNNRKRACSGGNPTPPAFRKRMLEKQVLSRIKKVHYKP